MFGDFIALPFLRTAPICIGRGRGFSVSSVHPVIGPDARLAQDGSMNTRLWTIATEVQFGRFAQPSRLVPALSTRTSYGVAEVATIGGFVRQYQVNVDPDKLRAYGILPVVSKSARRTKWVDGCSKWAERNT